MAVENCAALVVKQEVSVKVEPPRRGDSGLQYAQRTRRRVTWIRETRQTLVFAVGVEALECPQVHDDLAAAE